MMKDSSVSPVGLFDTRRQQKLLDGLAERFQTCLDQQQKLQTLHAEQRAEEETQLSSERSRCYGSMSGQSPQHASAMGPSRREADQSV